MKVGLSKGLRGGLGRWCAGGVFAAALWLSASAQQNPAAPPSATDNVAFRFAHGGDVAQAPMEILWNWLVVPVSVNQGKPGMFEIATCGLQSSIDPAPWIPANTTPQPHVTFKNTLLSMPDLDLGVAHIDPKPLADTSSMLGQPIAGILSADILSKFVVEIEYDRSAIHFHDPKTYQYVGKGITLPLLVRDGVPSVRAKLKVPGHHPIDDQFEVRTEYNGAIAVSKPMAGAHKFKLTHIKGFAFPNFDGGRTPTTRAETLTLGPYLITTPPVEFPETSGANSLARGGAIGNLVWKKFRVILDVPHQRMILESNATFPNNIELDMSGVALLAKGANLKTFEVAGVSPHSPGSDAGLQKGDVIAGVDNQPAADLTLSDLRAMLADLDHEYKLTVQRGDKSLEMKLRTRHLL